MMIRKLRLEERFLKKRLDLFNKMWLVVRC